MDNKNHFTKKLIRIAFRHSVAITVTVTAACIFWAISYILLRCIATMLDELGLYNLKGPTWSEQILEHFPFEPNMLIILVTSSILTVGIILPISAITWWVTHFKRDREFLTIPLITGMALIASFGLSTITAFLNEDMAAETITIYFFGLGIPLIILIGIYTWAERSNWLWSKINSVACKAH